MIIENNKRTNGNSVEFSHYSNQKIRTTYRLWYGSQFLLLYTKEFPKGKKFYSPSETSNWISEQYPEEVVTHLQDWLAERIKARN